MLAGIVPASLRDATKETGAQENGPSQFTLFRPKVIMGVLRISCVLLTLPMLWAVPQGCKPKSSSPPRKAEEDQRQPPASPARLLPVTVDGKSGYIDRTGKIVVRPQFSAGGPFSEGRAYVRVGAKWGYIGEDGHMAIEPQFVSAGQFSEGIACVSTDWPSESHPPEFTYIDKAGKAVFTVGGIDASGFADGLAPVEQYPEWLYLNRTGNVVFRVSCAIAEPFSEGRALVTDMNSGWGIIDQKGTLVTPNRFSDAERFSEGLAGAATNGKWGYVDKQGRYVVKARYDYAGRFSEGLAPVNRGGKYSYMIGCSGGAWAYIDRQGHTVLKLDKNVVRAEPFSDGMAAVQVRESEMATRFPARWGYINRKGEIVITPQFDRAGPFNDGIAEVEIVEPKKMPGALLQALSDLYPGTKVGYIDATGRYIWEPTE
jgi:hypothetical protein